MSKIISCKTSNDWPGYPSQNAIDGNLTTIWNSGAFAPQSIEVNLDKPAKEVTLGITPEMTPSFGDVTIEFLCINEKGHQISKSTYTLPCQTGVTEKVCLSTKDFGDKNIGHYNISRIRVTFLSSPSWIALRDIRIL